jgi:galactokinase
MAHVHRSQEATHLPLPSDGCKILVTNSMVSHELASSAYSVRVAQCAQAVQAIASHTGKPRKSLREVMSSHVLQLAHFFFLGWLACDPLDGIKTERCNTSQETDHYVRCSSARASLLAAIRLCIDRSMVY